MKKNLLKSVLIGTCIAATTTGCLPQKPVEEAATTNPRDALVKAMDTQATSLIAALNSVVVDSSFIKNLNLENPPQPIPMEADEDVKKAINYLLANQSINADAVIYYPDKRICSEVIAKNNPATCEKVMEKVSIAQVENDAESGYVQIHFAGTNPFNFVYSPNAVSLSTNLSSLFAAAEQLNLIQVALNEPSFADKIPATRQGALALTLGTSMGASIIGVTITSDINIAGVNGDGKNYSVSVPAGQNLVTAALYTAMGIGTVSVEVPAFSLATPIYNDQNVAHDAAVNFPGFSGQLTLNNAGSLVELTGLQFAAPNFSVSIDGQEAVQVSVPNALNAQITSIAGGTINIKALSDFSAQVVVSANALMDKSGSLSVAATQGFELLLTPNSEQAQVLAGSLSIIGTEDFLMNVNAPAGMCLQGTQQGPPLEAVVCQ